MSILLKKAIEIMKLDLNENESKTPPDLHEARLLALLGLEVISYARAGHSWSPKALLPGEFPEEIEPDRPHGEPRNLLTEY